MLEKNDTVAAKKQAAVIAKDVEVEDLMGLFKIRKGLILQKTVENVFASGIEKELMGIAKAPPPDAQVTKEAKYLARLSYVVAAVGEVVEGKAPEKDAGPKKRQDWITWSNDLVRNASLLAKAAKAKDANAINQAALKINATCNSCHSAFRD